MKLKLLFEPRDLWIGCYWDRGPDDLKLYLSLVPMFPLRITLRWMRDDAGSLR